MTDESDLRETFSGARISGKLTDNSTWVSEYCPDGTGTQWAWGDRFGRTWSVEGGQLCIEADDSWARGTKGRDCYAIERSTQDPSRLRARNLATEEVFEFVVSIHPAASCAANVAASG